MRIVTLVLAVMFLIFAFLQINDPDPLIWILIYGLMAVISVMAAFDFYPRNVLLVVGILFIAYSTVYFDGVLEWLRQDSKSGLFDEVAKMEHWYIEEAREFLGLMICVAVIIFYYYRSRKKTKG